MTQKQGNLRRLLVVIAIVVAAGVLLYWNASIFAWFGYSMVFGIPFALGAIAIYLGKVKQVLLALVVFLSAVGVAGIVLFSDISGLLCAGVAALGAVPPLIIGGVTGWILHRQVERKGLNQRPMSVTLLFVAASWLAMAFEGGFERQFEVEIVQTSRILSMSEQSAWSSLVFFEEVRTRPPMLARLGLPTPLYTEGSIDAVGDIKRCVYTKGYLRKRVVDLQPGRLLRFEVIEQEDIEDRSVELIDGSFEFEPVAGGTKVTLTTRYRPLLQARSYWRVFEHRLTRVLHEHVLDGLEAGEPRLPPVRVADR